MEASRAGRASTYAALLLILTSLVACGSKACPRPRHLANATRAPTPPRLAAIADNRVRFFEVRAGVIHPIGEQQLDFEEFVTATWIDGTELAVLGLANDQADMPDLWRVSPKARTPVALFDSPMWDTPPPNSRAVESFSPFEIVVTPQRHLWIGVCRWGHNEGGGVCAKRSYVRIVPSFAKQTSRPQSRPIAPAGVRVQLSAKGEVVVHQGSRKLGKLPQMAGGEQLWYLWAAVAPGDSSPGAVTP